MEPKNSSKLEQKKQEALEQLAQPLPGIPEPLGVKPVTGAPIPPRVDWNGNEPGTVTNADFARDPLTITTVAGKKPRKPRAPKVEKPPRKKAQGTYSVLTEGQVKLAGAGEDGGPLIRLVFVPSEVGSFRGRKAADAYALKLAQEKPGLVAVVVRLLGRVSVQTVSTVKLVRS